MNIERRFAPTEIREKGNTLVGHAATFNQTYDLGQFEEQIDSGAFDEAIERDDVRALWNHDPNIVLGRIKAGTLRLSKDKTGLLSEIDLPESATQIRESIERGDVDQMSFGFSVEDERWEKREGKTDLRTILKAQLYDVSPVTFPANPNTDIALRSHDAWAKEREANARAREELEETKAIADIVQAKQEQDEAA